MLERMRRAREELGLDLKTLEQRTRVRVHLLAAVENGRLDELPRGVYARAVIRAYASAVGIDPNRAAAALEPMLPDFEDPLDGIARVRGFARQHEPVTHRGVERGPAASVVASSPVAAPVVMPGLDAFDVFETAQPAAAWEPARQAAALIDGLVLAAVGLLVIGLTSWTAGVPVARLLETGVPALLSLFLVIATLYFVLLGGIVGTTVGLYAMGLAPGAAAAPVRMGTVVRRAGAVAARELSVIVDLVLPFLVPRVPGGKPAAPRSGTRWAGRAAAR